MRNAAVLLATAGAVVLVGLTGCDLVLPAASAPAPSSSRSPQASPETVPAAVKPALCGSKKPAPRDPFPYNRNVARRDGLLSSVVESDTKDIGGATYFDQLDSATLATLLKEKFIDPYERQNAAPTVWEIFQFLCRHPDVRAMGYAISIDRPDYRTSLETVYSKEIDAGLRTDAETFCRDADAVVTDYHLECFWD